MSVPDYTIAMVRHLPAGGLAAMPHQATAATFRRHAQPRLFSRSGRVRWDLSTWSTKHRRREPYAGATHLIPPIRLKARRLLTTRTDRQYRVRTARQRNCTPRACVPSVTSVTAIPRSRRLDGERTSRRDRSSIVYHEMGKNVPPQFDEFSVPGGHTWSVLPRLPTCGASFPR